MSFEQAIPVEDEDDKVKEKIAKYNPSSVSPAQRRSVSTQAIERRLLEACRGYKMPDWQTRLRQIQDCISEYPEAVECRVESSARAGATHYSHTVDSGRRPLHVLCAHTPNLEMIACFPAEQIRCMVMPDQMLPLHYACRRADLTSLAVIRYLIDQYPESVKICNAKGHWPLHLACAAMTNTTAGNTANNKKDGRAAAVVRILIQAWPESAQQRTPEGKLALHYACAASPPDLQLIQHLVDAYPPGIGQLDDQEWTPLHLACCCTSDTNNSDTVEMISYLLQQFPEVVGIPGHLGRIPLHVACWHGQPLEVIQLLSTTASSSSATAAATAENWVTKKDEKGALPLHCACRGDAGLAVMKYLVEQAPSTALECGKTPQEVAAYMTNNGVLYKAPPTPHHLLEWLEQIVPAFQEQQSSSHSHATATPPGTQHGRRSNDQLHLPQQDIIRYGQELHDACQVMPQSLESIICILAACPKAIEVRSRDDRLLPLHAACKHAAPLDVLELLLIMDPQAIRQLDENGNSALHWACGSRAPLQSIQVLVKEWPTGLFLTNKKGETPLTMASKPFRNASKPDYPVISFLGLEMDKAPKGLHQAGAEKNGRGETTTPLAISPVLPVNQQNQHQYHQSPYYPAHSSTEHAALSSPERMPMDPRSINNGPPPTFTTPVRSQESQHTLKPLKYGKPSARKMADAETPVLPNNATAPLPPNSRKKTEQTAEPVRVVKRENLRVKMETRHEKGVEEMDDALSHVAIAAVSSIRAPMEQDYRPMPRHRPPPLNTTGRSRSADHFNDISSPKNHLNFALEQMQAVQPTVPTKQAQKTGRLRKIFGGRSSRENSPSPLFKGGRSRDQGALFGVGNGRRSRDNSPATGKRFGVFFKRGNQNSGSVSGSNPSSPTRSDEADGTEISKAREAEKDTSPHFHKEGSSSMIAAMTGPTLHSEMSGPRHSSLASAMPFQNETSPRSNCTQVTLTGTQYLAEIPRRSSENTSVLSLCASSKSHKSVATPRKATSSDWTGSSLATLSTTGSVSTTAALNLNASDIESWDGVDNWDTSAFTISEPCSSLLSQGSDMQRETSAPGSLLNTPGNPGRRSSFPRSFETHREAEAGVIAGRSSRPGAVMVNEPVLRPDTAVYQIASREEQRQQDLLRRDRERDRVRPSASLPSTSLSPPRCRTPITHHRRGEVSTSTLHNAQSQVHQGNGAFHVAQDHRRGEPSFSSRQDPQRRSPQINRGTPVVSSFYLSALEAQTSGNSSPAVAVGISSSPQNHRPKPAARAKSDQIMSSFYRDALEAASSGGTGGGHLHRHPSPSQKRPLTAAAAAAGDLEVVSSFYRAALESTDPLHQPPRQHRYPTLSDEDLAPDFVTSINVKK